MNALSQALRQPRGLLGLCLTLLIVGLALLGPLLSAQSPTAFVGLPFEPPSMQHWLGTDILGRDILTRLLHGGIHILWMALASASLSMLIGVSLGLLAGYRGGWRDEVLMRGIDVLMSLPTLIVMLMVVALFGSQLWLIVLVQGLFFSPIVARLTRLLTLQEAALDYIAAARLQGKPQPRILFGEILPAIATPLLVEFGLRIVWAVASIATLNVLGCGIAPPTADWGLMINENRIGLPVQPWSVMAPALCIGLFALGVNFIADAIGRQLAGLNPGKQA